MAKRLAALVALSLIVSCAVRQSGDLAGAATEVHTPAEHAAVARFYRQGAQDLRADAERHTALASRWASKSAGGASLLAHQPGGYDYYYEKAADHCRRLSAYLPQAASEADAIADAHDALARRE